MTRTDLFMAAAQAIAICGNRMAPGQLARLLDDASQLPIESLGEEKAAAAALQYYEWHLHHGADPKRGKPKWLDEYERRIADQVLVQVSEAIAQTWWLHAETAAEDSERGQGPVIPQSCKPLILGREQGVIVTRHEAALFKDWVESIVGAEEEPFLFKEIEK